MNSQARIFAAHAFQAILTILDDFFDTKETAETKSKVVKQSSRDHPFVHLLFLLQPA